MGLESRRTAPPLPAPTETDSTTGGTEVDSKLTVKTTYDLPEDGTPVTIPTRRKKHDKDGRGGLMSNNNKSQTSLLIEYFEGGKGSQAESRRPSVRVKVTPSSKSRSRSAHDHIQITETKGTRKPSYTKRIQLSPNTKIDGEGDDKSLSSYASATEESNLSQRPIEVEIMPRRHGSPLIPTGESSTGYVQQNASEISSMPADSFLDGKSASPERRRSRSLSRGEVLAAGAATGLVAGEVADKLRGPSRRRSRSLSRERIVAQKAVEKVRGEKSEHRRKRSDRSRSVSNSEVVESIKSPRRRSSRSHHEESMVTGGESSLLSSQSRKSGDAYSFRSGTSKSSINNPKLLETVEDAIRRLILPELTALKREQSKHTSREKDRRGSITSGSGVSRDSRDESVSGRRLSDRMSATDLSGRPSVVVNDEEVITSTPRRRRDRKSERLSQDGSPRSFERGESEDTVVQDDKVRKKRSSDKHRGLEAVAAAAGLGALTSAALHKHESKDSLEEKKERRRRRTKSRSRTESLAESYEEREQHEIVPPMPLMSDINSSELTRSSILSAETERPLSASDEHRVPSIQEVPRGVASPSQPTPTRTPVALQQGLGMQHSNFSRGNLSLHSQNSTQYLRDQEYELDEHGRKVPMHGSPLRYDDEEYEDEYTEGNHHAFKSGLAGAALGGGLGALRNKHQRHEDEEEEEEEEGEVHHDPELAQKAGHYDYYQNTQTVPPPLRYVPYGQERRGLSPIQSVSGYTEDDYDQRQQRHSRLTQSTGSYSSLNKSALQKDAERSIRSMDSVGNVHQSHHDFADVRTGGLTDSELTQDLDGEYWEEQHRENDRNRDLDGTDSYRSSIPGVDYKHMTNYTEESTGTPVHDHRAAGQDIRGIGANTDYIHTPVAVESAVASLVNTSELTGSGYSGHNRQYDRRGSYASFDDGSEAHFTSRGNSPTKQAIRKHPSYNPDDNGMLSQFESRENSPTKSVEEYELDEHGRKVVMPRHEHKQSSEKAGLAGIAAGAAAAVLAGRKNKKSSADNIEYEERLETTGAPLQKSFKDRATEGVITSPKHSIDALSEAASHEHYEMGASGVPDEHHPMPAIGYGDGDSEVTTNPSIIQGPIGGAHQETRDHWSGQRTPPRSQISRAESQNYESDAGVKAAEVALVGAAVGAGTAAAISSHNRETGHDHDLEDEWQRTSEDRKRDTLITNPWEGTSPMAAVPEGLENEILAQGAFQGVNHDFGSKMAYRQAGSPNMARDEGYISSVPNARSAGAHTPERRTKGVDFLDQDLGEAAETLHGDPFYTPKHSRHLSGMSHGMGSPLYDSATGTGMERIQSKDIVALMDHLTVRDAQRSARDTEILVTLVRAAAEMRNSFEDMKRLLADTEDVIITEVQQNTDKSIQKAINGPRPQPPSVPRSLRQGSQDEMIEDIPAKRRNVFRRALKGLSMKSTNDLGKIEDMLVQLLGEVEGLKVAQGLKPHSSPGGTYDDLQQEGNYENDRGYEPEGHSTTASHGSHSGHLSIPKSRGNSTSRPFDSRKFSDHRISTVDEGEEDELNARNEAIDSHGHTVVDNQYEDDEELETPTRETFRADSVPLSTPPQQDIAPASLSNENTPRTVTDKSKKHKSSNSTGFIPRISRWSETTASTVLRGFRSSGRNSGRKENDQFASPPSRSGSDLANYEEHDPYGDDRLQPEYSEEQFQQYGVEEPMSLLPPEDPKYKAHRNSLNLQHPQPRPGQQYQTNLESQAQTYTTAPLSPKSVDWGSSTSLNRLPGPQINRYSNTTTNTGGNLSPISDGGYSNGSGQAPARPPKEPIKSEVPAKVRANKLQKPSPLSNEHLITEPTTYRSGSPGIINRPLSAALGVPARKPTGPRSMSSTSKGGDLSRDETVIRRKPNRDTFGAPASHHSGESETF